jgi:hypothetical protein
MQWKSKDKYSGWREKEDKIGGLRRENKVRDNKVGGIE